MAAWGAYDAGERDDGVGVFALDEAEEARAECWVVGGGHECFYRDLVGGQAPVGHACQVGYPAVGDGRSVGVGYGLASRRPASALAARVVPSPLRMW